MYDWGDLFNARQQLALVTFADLVRRAHAQMLAQGADPEFAKAVATYLALGSATGWRTITQMCMCTLLSNLRQ
jgi:adenine-specific DNA methylase